MTSLKKIIVCGAHGTGKSKICQSIAFNLLCQTGKFQINDFCLTNKTFKYNNQLSEYCNTFVINEQFREVVKDIPNFTKQTEEITLATYAKQLYLENLYIAQGKNILCDRSVLDTFVYYDYFNNIDLRSQAVYDIHEIPYNYNSLSLSIVNALKLIKSYSKIYLIEPSDREIKDDGFRLIDKKQQQEIHQLFLEYFKNFDNVEIVNQEEAHKEEFINKVVSEFIICKMIKN